MKKFTNFKRKQIFWETLISQVFIMSLGKKSCINVGLTKIHHLAYRVPNI